MGELESYIKTLPANSDALLYRPTPARDLRLVPHLYNWLVFGLSPGSLAQTSPLAGGATDTSDDHQPPQSKSCARDISARPKFSHMCVFSYMGFILRIEAYAGILGVSAST